jgi:predicted O-methyltransferase YrrM
MKFEDIDAIVRGLVGIPADRGRMLYDFVVEHRPASVLELGFCHGKSTCYMAAALDEIGAGRITTVDREEAKSREPTIGELLDKSGLGSYVDVHFEPTSYTWFLKKDIESATVDGRTVPKYDFCFIDGAHSWEVDGLAFFLTDKLLEVGGWLLLDDYGWSYATSSALKDTEAVRAMPCDEREEPQVASVYELLVKQHPGYADFSVDRDTWAWARKVDASVAPAVRIERRVESPMAALTRSFRRLRNGSP